MPLDDLVHVVDDDEQFLGSLRSLLEASGFSVSTYPTALQFLDAVQLRPRSCVITDIRMPAMDGLALQAEMAKRDIMVPMVFVTAYGDVALAVDALKAGAIDFIEKPVDEGELLDGVHRALDAAAAIWKRVALRETAGTRIASLSEREQDVFRLLVEGIPNKIISRRLKISPRTVEIHRYHIYKKLEAKNLAAVVRLALLAGFISPTDVLASGASGRDGALSKNTY